MKYKSEGVILKRTNLGEADRILTIFTEKHGKVKVIAKGIRKLLSHIGGNLELFCVVNLTIAEGRNFDIVTEAEITKCFIALRDNLEATNTAYYLAEIVDVMTEIKEPHKEIFDLLSDVLERLDHDQNKLLLAYFEMNFLAESGFKPELYKCLNCGAKITSGKNYFSLEAGGLICQKCYRSELLVTDEAIKVFRLFLTHQINIIGRIKTDKILTREIEKLSSLYLSFIAQREFKTKRFLKK